MPNGLAEKAAENYHAAASLIVQGMLNAAASRAYYAVYQAAIARLQAAGRKPGDFKLEATRWDHDIVKNNLGAVGVKDRRLRDTWEHLLAVRVQADYRDGDVEPEQLDEEVMADVRDILSALGVNT